MKYYLVILFAICFLPAFTQTDWELRKDEDNIKVYTKKKEGYSIKASKVITVMETTLPVLVAIMMDAENFYKVVPTSKSSKLLKKVSENEFIYYVATKAPWPVSDRDGVYSMNFSQDPNTKTVKIKVGNIPDFYPVQDDHIRVPASEGLWQFKPLGNGKVEIIYESVADAGGSIPAWLANSSVVNIPFGTIENLRELVKLEKYKGQTFSFLTN